MNSVARVSSPGQTIATLQRNIYCNTAGRSMLHTFVHPVATCCDMLGVAGSNLTILRFKSRKEPFFVFAQRFKQMS